MRKRKRSRRFTDRGNGGGGAEKVGEGRRTVGKEGEDVGEEGAEGGDVDFVGLFVCGKDIHEEHALRNRRHRQRRVSGPKLSVRKDERRSGRERVCGAHGTAIERVLGSWLRV